MAPQYRKCSGCQNTIKNKEFLECAVCKMRYDIDCANISSERFYGSFAQDIDRRRTWKCPECCSKQPKTGNLNTPIHSTGRCDSVVNAGSEDLSLHTANITVRTRKPHLHSLDSPNRDEYVTEEKLRNILKEEFEVSFRSIIKELISTQVENLVEELKEMKDSLNFFNKQYEDIKSTLEAKNAIIDYLQKDNNILKSSVTDLSDRLNQVEQNLRECNIEVNGIPEHKQENLNNTVEQLIKTVTAPISADDILLATRVAKVSKDSDRPRALIVKFRTPRLRDTVIASVAAFNKKNPNNKLSSKHLGLAGTSRPVFVAEHLSPLNRALHAATRHKAKELNYKYTWVRNGRIFIRKNESSNALLIRNMDGLSLIK